MKRQKKWMRFLLSLLIAGIFFSGNVLLMAQPHHGSMHQQNGFWQQLTQDQKEQLRETIQKLRDQGATREEIREEIQTMLTNWGIDVPDNFRLRFGARHFGLKYGYGIFDQLNEPRERLSVIR